MAFCPNCGTAYEPGAKFCRGCGQPVSAPAAPQQPHYQPQQPVYQAPQYQQPVYQTPQPQQPVYQAPQYQQPVCYAPANAAANQAAAKKAACTALILCGVALVLYVLARIASHISYRYMGTNISTPVSTYITQFIKFALCATFPFLAFRAASTGNRQSAKGIATAALCYLGVQILFMAFMAVRTILMRYVGLDVQFLNPFSIMASYIAGSNLLSLLIGISFWNNPFLISNLLHMVSAACCLVPTALAWSSATKLKNA